MFIRCRSNETFSFMGGGLEKLQGGYKEEQYFQNRNNELLVKWRQELKSLRADATMKASELPEASDSTSLEHDDNVALDEPQKSSELSASEWSQLNQAPKPKMHRTALQESCLLSKHKNCREELYFYNEVRDVFEINNFFVQTLNGFVHFFFCHFIII